ncbi:MAG: ABC transporter ATP-binding protein [Deinococcota bacterium]
MAFLELTDAAIGYQKGTLVVDGLNLSVQEGELVSFLGPSGCGKTTTLRAIAGFVQLQRGNLNIASKTYNDVPANKRNIGVVFQSYALFPHLSVFDNTAFGLRLRKVRGPDLRRRVADALEMVGLSGFETRLPAQLSGGQQQRVAMARAVVIEPQLLLLDEPLSNLDAKLRIELRTQLQRLQKRLGVTSIYVTHDQTEALALSDRIVVMNAGKIEQLGSPEDIYQQPATLFVAQFMGFANQFNGHVSEIVGDTAYVDTPQGTVQTRIGQDVTRGSDVTVAFRASTAELYPNDADTPEDTFRIDGQVILRTFEGENITYLISTALGEFEVSVSSDSVSSNHAHIHERAAVRLCLPEKRCIAYVH